MTFIVYWALNFENLKVFYVFLLALRTYKCVVPTLIIITRVIIMIIMTPTLILRIKPTLTLKYHYEITVNNGS